MSLSDLYTQEQALNCAILRAKITNEEKNPSYRKELLFSGKSEYHTTPSFSSTINLFSLLDTYIENHHQPVKRLLASSKTRMSSALVLLVVCAFVVLTPFHSLIALSIAGAFALASIAMLVVNYFAKKGLQELSIALELQTSIAAEKEAIIIDSHHVKKEELRNLHRTICAATELSDDLSERITQFISLSIQIQAAVKGQEILKQKIKNAIHANLLAQHIRESGDLFQITKDFVGGNYRKQGQEIATIGTLNQEREAYTLFGLFNPNEHAAAGVNLPEKEFSQMLAEVLALQERLASRDVKALEIENTTLRANQTALSADLDRVHSSLVEESKQNLDLRNRNVELSTQMAAKQSESLALLVQVHARTDEIEALRKETRALSEQLAKATAQSELAQSENGEKTRVVQVMQSRLEGLQVSIQDKEVEIQSKIEEIARLRELHLAQMESQQWTARQELEQARTELARVQSAHEARLNSKNLGHDEEITKLRSAFGQEIEKLTSSFNENMRLKEIEINELGLAREALSKEIETLKQKVAHFRCDSLSHLNNHTQSLAINRQLESNLTTSRERVAELESRIRDLSEELDAVSRTKIGLEKKIAGLEQVRSAASDATNSGPGIFSMFSRKKVVPIVVRDTGEPSNSPPVGGSATVSGESARPADASKTTVETAAPGAALDVLASIAT